MKFVIPNNKATVMLEIQKLIPLGIRHNIGYLAICFGRDDFKRKLKAYQRELKFKDIEIKLKELQKIAEEIIFLDDKTLISGDYVFVYREVTFRDKNETCDVYINQTYREQISIKDVSEEVDIKRIRLDYRHMPKRINVTNINRRYFRQIEVNTKIIYRDSNIKKLEKYMEVEGVIKVEKQELEKQIQFKKNIIKEDNDEITKKESYTNVPNEKQIFDKLKLITGFGVAHNIGYLMICLGDRARDKAILEQYRKILHEQNIAVSIEEIYVALEQILYIKNIEYAPYGIDSVSGCFSGNMVMSGNNIFIGDGEDLLMYNDSISYNDFIEKFNKDKEYLIVRVGIDSKYYGGVWIEGLENANKVINYYRIKWNKKRVLTREETRIRDMAENIKDLGYGFCQMVNTELFLEYDTLQEVGYYKKVKEISNSNCEEQFKKFTSLLQRKLVEEEKETIINLAWETAKIGAMNYFADIWDKEYGIYFNDNLSEFSIDELVKMYCLINEINPRDDKTIGKFTYYLIRNQVLESDSYIDEFLKIKKVIDNIYEQLEIDAFERELQMIGSEITHYCIEDTDFMTGYEFEKFVCKLFKKMGYDAMTTKASGDQGIDVIAKKINKTIGIQAKCYSSGKVGNKAVQEVIAGLLYHKCEKGLVITNSYFTNSAIALADKSNVLLWDRDVLNQKIQTYLN